jgi:hypothetical protein
MANVFDGLEDANGNFRALTKSDMKSRFLKLAPRAFKTLEGELLSGDGKVRVMAATAILDRCGYGPQAKLTLSDETEDMSSMSTMELAARAAQIAKTLLEQHEEQPAHKQPFDVH